MKLLVMRRAEPQRTVAGQEARAVLKAVLKGASQNILLPEPPFTGIVRRRCLERLRENDPIWDMSDENGQPHRNATILFYVHKIKEVILPDGTKVEVEDAEGQKA